MAPAGSIPAPPGTCSSYANTSLTRPSATKFYPEFVPRWPSLYIFSLPVLTFGLIMMTDVIAINQFPNKNIPSTPFEGFSLITFGCDNGIQLDIQV